jgi:hypothetical protein
MAGFEGPLYATLGATVALDDTMMVSGGVALLQGDWYACGTETTGVWLFAGPACALSESFSGFYLHPRAHLRVFDTVGGRSTGGWFSCSAQNARGSEFEVGVGLDIGAQAVLGPLFVGPVIGLKGGYCIKCPAGSGWPYGDIGLFGDVEPRADRFVVDVNLNVVQLGVAFLTQAEGTRASTPTSWR